MKTKAVCFSETLVDPASPHVTTHNKNMDGIIFISPKLYSQVLTVSGI